MPLTDELAAKRRALLGELAELDEEIKKPNMADRQHVMAITTDLVSDFLYYDRKEDDKCPQNHIEMMIATGQIIVDEIVAEFRDGIEKSVDNWKRDNE